MTANTTTDQQRITQLKKLAEVATPGTWKVERLSGGYHNVGIRVTGPLVSGYTAFLNTRWPSEAQCWEQEANALWIAAANPQVITSLIERIGELEQALQLAEQMLCAQEAELRSFGAETPNAEPAILAVRAALASAQGEQNV